MKKFLRGVIVCCAIIMLISNGFAQTWTQTAVPVGALAVASSADGNKMVAVVYNGIYSSTNAGANWILHSYPFLVSVPQLHIALSANGHKLVLAPSSGTSLFSSVDLGATWVTNYVTAKNWFWASVALSADGSTFVAANSLQVGPGGSFFESTNSGATWFSINVAPASFYLSFVLSADGSIIAVGSGSGIFTTTDSGATWILGKSSPGTYSVAMSANGAKLVAGSIPGVIYTSTDFGATWISNNVLSMYWSSVASSADGSKLIAGAVGGIYTSTDSGASWISNNVPSTGWQSVALSADGCKMIASSDSGVWISETTPTPQLNLTASSSNLLFSWTVPSTKFVLQQNLDLTTTNWMTLTNVPSLNLTNLNDELTLASSNRGGFFRLISQ